MNQVTDFSQTHKLGCVYMRRWLEGIKYSQGQERRNNNKQLLSEETNKANSEAKLLREASDS